MDQKELPRETVCTCGDGAEHSAVRASGRAYECLIGNGIVSPFPREAQTFDQIVKFLKGQIVIPITDQHGAAEVRLDLRSGRQSLVNA